LDVHELSVVAAVLLMLLLVLEEVEELLLLLVEVVRLLAPVEAAVTASVGCGASAGDSTPGTGTTACGMGYDVMLVKG
jgi:hypothetical protein